MADVLIVSWNQNSSKFALVKHDVGLPEERRVVYIEKTDPAGRLYWEEVSARPADKLLEAIELVNALP